MGRAQLVALCFADASTPIVGSDSGPGLRLRAENIELRALARWEDDGGSLSQSDNEGTLGLGQAGHDRHERGQEERSS